MATTASTSRKVEIKTRTTNEVKRAAMDVYSHWGINLNDAINMFLVKSIEVGGLPFNLRTEVQMPSYGQLASHAYKAPLNNEGVAVLPTEWAESE